MNPQPTTHNPQVKPQKDIVIKHFDSLIEHFVRNEDLPEHYSKMAKQWFLPLAQQLIADITDKELKVLGIAGGQGSGKSTLAKLLKNILEEDAKYKNRRLNVIVLSLDDFYLTKQERRKLSAEIHPLFRTRGVPGTHDISLAIKTIELLLYDSSQQGNPQLKIPRFDKSRDERFPESEWEVSKTPVDLIILEGWCLASEAQSKEELETPVNRLEKEEDPEATWRQYANTCLANQYTKLWNKIDRLILLKIPCFDIVYKWRLKQEKNLSQKSNTESNKTANGELKIMDEESIQRFIQHFERITKHNLKTLPTIADIIFKLNEQQIIVEKLGHP